MIHSVAIDPKLIPRGSIDPKCQGHSDPAHWLEAFGDEVMDRDLKLDGEIREIRTKIYKGIQKYKQRCMPLYTPLYTFRISTPEVIKAL